MQNRSEPVLDVNPFSGAEDLEIGRTAEFNLPGGAGVSVLAYNERSPYPTVALINFSEGSRILGYALYPGPDRHISKWEDINQPRSEVIEQDVEEDEAQSLAARLRSLLSSLDDQGQL